MYRERKMECKYDSQKLLGNSIKHNVRPNRKESKNYFPDFIFDTTFDGSLYYRVTWHYYFE